MTDKLHTFSSDRITITFDKARCLHAAECLRGSPTVFDTGRRQWIDPTADEPDVVAETVSRCPTGALHFVRLDGGKPEPIPPSNVVTLSRNGPLYLRGDIRIVGEDGAELRRDTRVALCRCGASRRKPFCDGSHATAGFRDGGILRSGESDDGVAPRGPLAVTPVPGGPLRLEGPVDIEAQDGVVVTKPKATLCRCGASGNKPFCDGSHGSRGFRAGSE